MLFTVPAFGAGEVAQQPTGSIPTVTSTAVGAEVTVNNDQEQINIRSGPGTDYPKVGVLVAGQTVPAVGRSPGGDWIQIVYPGVPGGRAWVYAFLVGLPTGNVPIVEPPPTPTPLVTPTVDPTLAAQFDIEVTPTRLPTFTPPPPLSFPNFEQPSGLPVQASIPMGMIIGFLAVVGLFGFLISIIRRG
jgi:hypothetical protein